MRSRFAFATLAVILPLVSACGGGGGGGGGTSSTQVAPPPPPPANPLTLSLQTLTFLGLGASLAQTVTASESNYTGTFSATGSTCNGIATVTAQSGSNAAFVVTPVAAGTCSFSISDTTGQSKAVSVIVTTTIVGGT